ncbi:Iron only hydrogenase large subunit, C-terminal domain [Saccharicrinis carchari]|uniref:Iron only hydrogenase large subunit, C-terminal domain n=1 Tax=Saccharicrinis carchari TaxID=1168039 RepID=A0A521DT83_SACCC|nr:[Fe-Fe] hydrogenase large subunit C-terminal domain-containing protein [Saccharicrinis carchari]SMO74828.1 Iron only hydrogenase large subunit, C-terminal domain [Saccharicrinis carchari]
MAQLIKGNKDKCNLSFTCIRVCPAKAIKIADNYANIMPDRCIGCGNCVVVCAQKAISFRNQVDTVRKMLNSDVKVAAICDPAISGEFDDISDYRKFVAMIRELGFSLVSEVAFGVDLVAQEYKELLGDFHGKYYVSTHCPPVRSYVEKYRPGLVDNLAPIVPPFVAMAKVMHKKYGSDVKVVYISACVAAKDEAMAFAHTDGKIDAVISFQELRAMFKEDDINEASVEYSDFDPPVGRKGGLYPINQGLWQTVDMQQDLLNTNIISVDGRNNFLGSLKEFSAHTNLNQNLDLYYCEGCVMGPGMSPGDKKFLRQSNVVRYVEKRLKVIDNTLWEKDMKEFKDIDLSRSFKITDRRLPQPSEQEVQRVLHDMGKSNVEDQLGCGACGYPSCKEFAVAYCQGLTNFEMCYSYSLKTLHTYINKVHAANENLKNTKEALKESEEKARKEELAAREAAETITAMLNKIRAGIVMVDARLNIIEANLSFVNMMGEDAKQLNEIIPGLKGADINTFLPFGAMFSTVLQTGQEIINRDTTQDDVILNVSVFTIKKHQIVGGIIRDLTAPEVRREEVINRARSVIRDNLQTVQQIAFLLGESASKTEKVLSSIIEAQKLGDSHGG